jgi:DNA-binding transcriptional ArsR family regulator
LYASFEKENWHNVWEVFACQRPDLIYFFKTFSMRKANSEAVASKKEGNEVPLDYVELRKAALVLRAVNHKLRQRIIDLLEENKSMTVTDIYVKLRLEQSVASQHLAILRRAGVVRTDRQGKFIFYSLDRERLDQISSLVEELAA